MPHHYLPGFLEGREKCGISDSISNYVIFAT